MSFLLSFPPATAQETKKQTAFSVNSTYLFLHFSEPLLSQVLQFYEPLPSTQLPFLFCRIKNRIHDIGFADRCCHHIQKEIHGNADGNKFLGHIHLCQKQYTEHQSYKCKRADEAGIKVIIATGRMFEAAVFYAEELNMNVPLICFNGGQIRECISGKVLFEKLMNPDIAQEILQYCHQT